jgi:acetyltransferase
MPIDPNEWERHITLSDRRAVYIRPIRPDDESLYRRFLRK